MKLIVYVVCCALVSLFYYNRVSRISIKEVGLILLAVFAIDTMIKTAKTCVVHYEELIHYFDDQTMAIVVIAMAFVSWLAIEPLWSSIKRAPSERLKQVTDD
ncbi:hypothetical protein EAY71_22550 [Vibrio anguillarum]|uniref:hypothetical protein n=1 Tax=Vibrio anguillarum TaxID=55601 RepID=UPI00188A1A09|nr:hypothetical protein [Vibrio anguillarum]MBF4269648.1 hypothetical protein [Vibrio anguillarum]MBF4426010.1 hypothetical protein [Vibrio anguillarum]